MLLYKFEQQEKDSDACYIVIYDISDNKRRNKISHCLEKYGKRIQKSAFEVCIDKKKMTDLIEKLKNLIHAEDDLRIFQFKSIMEMKKKEKKCVVHNYDVVII